MRPIILLCLLYPIAAQAILLKCTDNKGQITYTNSPCAKVGLKEAAVIPEPPPPALDGVAKVAEPAKAAVEKKTSSPKANETASLQLMKSAQADSDQCASLNNTMGRIMDEMDAARRRGQSTDTNGWNENLKKLQAEKSRLSCF
jgi:hypothetical protein